MSDPSSRGLDILHVDMDCFFAAVEVRDEPNLAGKPVIVGGLGLRGVVASCSYEARVYGVHSAMTTAEARRLCPHGEYISGRHDKYRLASKELMAMLRDVTPLVEPVSLDEAYLDVSGAHGLLGESEQIATRLRDRVQNELQLLCSVGIGRTKLIAKLASKGAKPVIDQANKTVREGSGVLAIAEEDESGFLRRLPVRALPGAGPRTAERLSRLGISSVGELADLGRERLVHLLGKSHGGLMYDLANGIDDRRVEVERPTKSIGREETYARDDFDPVSLESKVRALASEVASRVRENELAGRTIALKLRYGDFTTITRARTVDKPTTSAVVIAEVCVALLKEIDLVAGVRLLGVQVSNFDGNEESSEQLSLFVEPNEGPSALIERHGQVETAADAIRQRFGSEALTSLATTEARAHRTGNTGPLAGS